MSKYIFTAIIPIIALFISGCASYSSSSSKPYNGKISLPKAPSLQIPGGNTSNWRYLGTSTNGQLITEINNSSIVATKDANQYSFQGRKTIYNPYTYTYANGQPPYKYIIENWLIDCTNKQYVLVSATTYNKLGIQLNVYDYKGDDSVRWMQFGDDSIANAQYEYVCQNKNRHLGY